MYRTREAEGVAKWRHEGNTVTPKDPVRLIVERALLLERLSNGIARDGSGVLRALFDEIVALIAKHDPTAVQPRYRRDRIDRIVAQVEKLAGDAWGEWHKQVRADLARLGRLEAQHTRDVLVASLGRPDVLRGELPTVNMMKAILDTNPFQGDTLAEWASIQQAGTVRRVRQQIQIGMTAEEPIDAIMRRIRGRSNGRGGFVGGVLETTTREATALTRTAVTEVANEAALMTYRQNAHVVSAVEIVVTLDSRTCSICLQYDGKQFPVESTFPKPAYHWNCRCFMVAVVDWERLGLEPPEEGTRAARDASGRSTQVRASMDFDAWLRSMPASVQRDVLGAGRAEAFRSGKSLADLIRSDGRWVRLDDLEAA